MHTLNFNSDKTSNNPQKSILQSSKLVHFKNVNAIKDKERQKYFPMEGAKKYIRLNI